MTPSSPGPVRIAVLGCGAVACRFHLPTLRRLRGALLVGSADPDGAARARAMRLTGIAPEERAEALLGRDDVDAVVISAPTPLHAELAVAAARAGKHFYLEKPMAVTADEARRVKAAAEEAGVIAAIGFNFRHNPVHEQARALVAERRIGQVRAVQTVFCEPVLAGTMPAWKQRRASGGGVLLDLASHHLDLLRWLLEDEPITVEARIASEATEHDRAALSLAMRGGVEVQSYFSFGGGPADFVELIGDQGTLRIDRLRGRLTLRVGRRFGYGIRTAWLPPTSAAFRLRRLVRPSYEPSFRRALAAFVDRVRGQATPTASLDDGARSLAAVLAAEASARREMRLEVDPI